MNRIVDTVYEFFVSSTDFNGITLTELAEKSDTPYSEIVDIVKKLVIDNVVSIQSDVNPHIIRLYHYDTNRQIELLEEARGNTTTIVDEFPIPGTGNARIVSESHLLCVYPSVKYLQEHRDTAEFNDRPFEKELALGTPQLTPLFFELDVLRQYMDPRYELILEDYSGSIHAIDERLKEKDQVFLQTFGLGVDENEDRVVVAYLRYLCDLTPEHQVYWKSKQINDGCKVFAEYFQNKIFGEWTSSCSSFSAFIGEQEAVNTLTNAIFGKPLFSDTFGGRGNKPAGFNYLFVPTLNNYEQFISVLDKMMSDNINKKFFDGKVELFTLETNKDGTKTKRYKGTIQLLEEWLRSIFTQQADFDVFDKIFSVFKKVRSLRQKPAHKIAKDCYDKKYIHEQRIIISEAYQAMALLRDIFRIHKEGKNVRLPDWLDTFTVKPF